MDKRIFILNGMARSGKDTFVSTLYKLGIEAVHYSYVDFTRFMLNNAGIAIADKTDKVRKLLCDINNTLEEYDDTPFKDCCEIADDFKDNWLEGDWLIIDCRDPKNIERLKKATNAETIFIKSNLNCDVTSADKAVSKSYEYDYYIDNTGTLTEFERNIEEFTRNLKLAK